jgi:hypothetical protein
MWQRTMTFAKWQTPAQRKAQAAIWRRHDKQQLTICNVLQFWRVCEEGACTRRQTCCGDPHACFDRQWARYSEEEKVWIRAAIKARADGLSPEAAGRAADAELADYVALMAKHGQPGASLAPAPEPAQTAMQETLPDGARIVARVRSL